jgi:hypothetical protein
MSWTAPSHSRSDGEGLSAANAPAPQGEWWCRAPQLATAVAARSPLRTQGYRFGDVVVDVESDLDSLHEELWHLFAECAVSGEDAHALERVHCFVRPVAEPPLAGIRVSARSRIDLAAICLSLLQPRPDARYCAVDSAHPGWQLIEPVDRPGAALIAVGDGCCLVDPANVPPFFLRDFAVATALSVQRDVLFMHAASVSLRGAGVLLAGRAGAGKTTLSTTLASRGHGLLGDDLAALRVHSLELLPLRRTLYIKRGLRAREVDELIRRRPDPLRELPTGAVRVIAEAKELFPRAGAATVPLRAAFFLRGFRKEPRVESFQVSLQRIDTLRTLPVRLQWGISPGRRALKFSLAARLLCKVDCYFLDVGRPEETAELVEQTVERQSWV